MRRHRNIPYRTLRWFTEPSIITTAHPDSRKILRNMSFPRSTGFVNERNFPVRDVRFLAVQYLRHNSLDKEISTELYIVFQFSGFLFSPDYRASSNGKSYR